MARLRCLGLSVLLFLGGCAVFHGGPPLADSAVELTATPFYPQLDHQCGPAALATVLGASGVTVPPDELTAELYVPDRRGTFQLELVAAARSRGRLAIQLEGATLPDVVALLEAGRPVLVLQNLATALWPVWHYAVVIGYLPESDRFVLRSGTDRRLLMRRGRFAATWRRGEDWALLVVDPKASAANLPRTPYLKAAADLEKVGAYQEALAAFRQAARAWPAEATAQLGVANNLYYLERRDAAAAAYRHLLADHPGDVVGVHNLVMLLIEQRHYCEARQVANAADDLAGELIDAARHAVAATPATCNLPADEEPE